MASTCPRWRARRVPASGTLSSVPVVQSPVPAGERDIQETPRKGSDTKERILDLAEAAVLEKGFAATVIGVATGWLS